MDRMTLSTDKIRQADLNNLEIIRYPDPRLAEPSTAVDPIDEALLLPLTHKMFDLMFLAKGVGLAAPQVGINVRLFVASPAYEPDDRRVYINPRIVSVDQVHEDEEGCLSVPGIQAKIRRYGQVTIEAADLKGKVFQQTGNGLLARIFQHETDHLEGRLIVDRMGTLARLSYRRTIRELEDKFLQRQAK